jgi:Lar family restriction alleviation protein
MNERTCSTCRWCAGRECRFNPPVQYPKQHSDQWAVFPQVQEGYFCSHWELKLMNDTSAGVILGMSLKVQPCPFCGSQNSSMVDSSSNVRFEGACSAVYCITCGARGSLEHSRTDAILAWNKRISC